MAEDRLKIHLSWVGVEDALKRLDSVKPNIVARCLKPAIDKSARMVAKAMKQSVSRRRTGLLRASIGVRTSPDWRKGRVYAVIGPRRSFKSTGQKGGVTTVSKWRMGRIKRKGFEAFASPTRYAHLIEFGHKKGKGRTSAKAYPFMLPAWQSTKNAAEQLAASELRRMVAKLLVD